MPFLSTIVLTLSIGGLLVVLRAVLRLPRRFITDLALTALGGIMILGLHWLSPDLFGLDPISDLPFELIKHTIEVLIILMVLVAF